MRAILVSVLLLFLAAAAASGQKLKVHVSVDMEGVAGVVTEQQLGPEGFEYARFREFMTGEALAAVSGAREAGATEIVVADSHGNKQNLLVERFPADVRLIRGGPRRLSMRAGIDESFDAAVFIGYHAATTSTTGVRAHTFSSARLTRVALNGANVSEGAFNAALAGHYKVPVVFVSGDDAAVADVRAAAGNVPAVETKRALGFHAANTLTPEAAQTAILREVAAALKRVREFRPYRIEAPVKLELGFKSYLPAEVLCFLRPVRRVDSHTIGFEARDVLEAVDFVSFATTYRPDLEP
jgi:D-amino peptidase